MKNSKSNKFAKTLITAVTLMLLMPLANASDNWPIKGNFAKGAKAWADNCTRCHNVRDPKELRDDQWITTIYHMRLRAGLTGQETRDIVTFMQMSN